VLGGEVSNDVSNQIDDNDKSSSVWFVPGSEDEPGSRGYHFEETVLADLSFALSFPFPVSTAFKVILDVRTLRTFVGSISTSTAVPFDNAQSNDVRIDRESIPFNSSSESSFRFPLFFFDTITSNFPRSSHSRDDDDDDDIFFFFPRGEFFPFASRINRCNSIFSFFLRTFGTWSTFSESRSESRITCYTFLSRSLGVDFDFFFFFRNNFATTTTTTTTTTKRSLVQYRPRRKR
jgi:hypothetical protein